MKRFLLLVIVLCVVSPAAWAQKAGATEQAILKLEQAWEDALVKNDFPALDKLYADNLIYTHSSGVVDNKTTYIDNLKAGNTKYLSLKRDDIKVTVYGNTAVVTCHWLIKLLSKGNPVEVNARYLHVYVKQKAGWQMVAHQATRIAQ